MNVNYNSIIRQLYDYLPNEKFSLRRRNDNNLELCFKDKNIMITILSTNTWEEIKRHIDKRFKVTANDNCSICDKLECNALTCAKCANTTCVDCFINIIKINIGKYVCPFCRHSIGSVKSIIEIENMVKNINLLRLSKTI